MSPLILLGLIAEYFGAISTVIGAATVFATKNVWLRPVGKFFYKHIYKNIPAVKTNDKLNKLLEYCIPGEGPSIFDITIENQKYLQDINKKLVMLETNVDITSGTLGLYKFAADEKGDVIHSSHLLNSLLGVGPEYCQSKGWKTTIVPEDLEHYVINWKSAVEDGRDFVCDARLRNLMNGTIYDTTISATAVHDAKGVIGWIGYISVNGHIHDSIHGKLLVK